MKVSIQLPAEDLKTLISSVENEYRDLCAQRDNLNAKISSVTLRLGVLKTAAGLPVPKNPAAVALGRLGGLKGGPARKASQSPERLREIASNAAKSRWLKRKNIHC